MVSTPKRWLPDMSDRLITPVILSGGGGTRLWPLSRPEKPKQFLALTAEETMLQVTARRVADRSRYAAPLIVASQAHADEIEAQLAAIGSVPMALVLEPAGRNTAPAIALAALAVDPDSVLLVMPSDHVVGKEDAFHAAVAAALSFAQDGWLVTFGITPTHAETGFGYVKLGETIGKGIHRVDRFIEKPDRAAAEAMLSAGGHAWNGGIFLFRAGSFLDALSARAPDILAAAQRAMDGASRQGARIAPDREAFLASPSDSIDYAVMEKASRVAVVPVDLAWSDVGSWDALHALGPQDEAGNLATGATQLVETSGCLVRAEGVRVSTLGISDLIVIATGDEVVILPRGRSQEVKKLL